MRPEVRPYDPQLVKNDEQRWLVVVEAEAVTQVVPQLQPDRGWVGLAGKGRC